MGTQQLLLVILGIVIIGIAMTVGLTLFSAESVQANRDEIIHDINNIATYAYQYKTRIQCLGGGNNSYVGCTLSSKLASNENATYVLSGASIGSLVVTGTSTTTENGYVVGTIDADGNVTIDLSNFNE